MILSTGLLRRIARSHPTILLDVLASPANASVLDGASHVRRVLVFDKRRPGSYMGTALALRRAAYDAVIDCMVTAPSLTTLMLMGLTGARYRIGIAGRDAGAGLRGAINVPVPPSSRAHIADKLGALATAFGLDPDALDWRPEISLTPTELAAARAIWTSDATDRARAPAGARGGPAGLRVLVNVSAGTAARRWPVERYVAVIAHIMSREGDANVVVVAAPWERSRALETARETGGRAVDTPRLRDALALVATADFVLTPDTSITHAASAFARPAITMCPEHSVAEWGLYGEPGESVTYPGEAIVALQSERVIDAVDRVLARSGGERRS